MLSTRFFSSIALMVSALAHAGCEQSHAAPRPTPPSAPQAAAPKATASGSASQVKATASKGETIATAKREPMNVLLLVVDAMRWDMSWEGYERETAPNLGKLYQRSVRWERGYAVASFTSKSVASLLSGRYPSELNRTTPFFTRYRDDNLMMAEVLQEAGVRTISAQAHKYLDKRSGLTQGFDRWELVPGIEFDANKDNHVTSPKHTKLAIDLLSEPETTKGRFFGYFHYMDPHHVYNAHEGAPDWGAKWRDRYDQEMWYTDKWIQKLLDHIESQPWGKRTALIVTGDHGEAFGEHKLYKHAFEIYDVLVRVPLFVYVPGVKPRKVARWRGHIDIVPTVLDLMGVAAPEGLQGKSLVPEILGEDQPDRPIVCDLPADTHNVRHRAVIEDGWKIISFGNDFRYELYNVKDDPGEKTNLYRKDKERAASMLRRYKEISASVKDAKARGGKPVKR